MFINIKKIIIINFIFFNECSIIKLNNNLYLMGIEDWGYYSSVLHQDVLNYL